MAAVIPVDNNVPFSIFKLLNGLKNYGLIRELSLKSRVAWSLACKDALTQVAAFNKEASNIIDYLSPFFRTKKQDQLPEESKVIARSFREALCTSNALVVGSMATNFIGGQTYSSTAAMDVLAVRGGVKLMETWALAHEFSKVYKTHAERELEYAYAFTHPSPTRAWPRLGEPPVRVTLTYRHLVSGRKMHLLVAEGALMEAVLHSPLSTMMNFFDFEAAYSLFPVATFEERVAVLNRPAACMHSDDVLRCRERGWHVLNGIPEQKAQDKRSEWWEGIRFLGDAKTLRILAEPRLDALYAGLIRGNSWKMQYRYRWGLKVDITYDPFLHPQLKNEYIVFGPQAANCPDVLYRPTAEDGTDNRSTCRILCALNEDLRRTEQERINASILRSMYGYQIHFMSPFDAFQQPTFVDFPKQ
ncbi:hypothetical protein BJ165DRAFT_1535486 [Panaeolus papilionaceus]|nr:hypothetical protein BJ165DRAFT_1535486 [Panaeolus papilionaceus]